MLFDHLKGPPHDVGEPAPIRAQLEQRDDLGDALGKLWRRQVIADGADRQGSSNDAVELDRQRRQRASANPNQRQEIIEQGRDARQIEASLERFSGLELSRRNQAGQTHRSVGADAHMGDRDVAVRQRVVGHDAVQGRDGDRQVGQHKQALIEREGDPSGLHRGDHRRQVEPIEPGRDHEGRTLDDTVAKVGRQMRMADPDERVAAACQLRVQPRRQPAIDLQEERPAQRRVRGLVAVGDGRAAELLEQGEVA